METLLFPQHAKAREFPCELLLLLPCHTRSSLVFAKGVAQIDCCPSHHWHDLEVQVAISHHLFLQDLKVAQIQLCSILLGPLECICSINLQQKLWHDPSAIATYAFYFFIINNSFMNSTTFSCVQKCINILWQKAGVLFIPPPSARTHVHRCSFACGFWL